MEAHRLLEAAREQLRTGHYDRAIGTLSGCDGWPYPDNEHALLLRAEIAVRRDAVSALELLARVSDVFQSQRAHFGYGIVSSKAYAQCSDLDAAAEMLEYAARHCSDAAESAILSYHRSRLRWLRREYDPDDGELAQAIDADDPGLRFEALAVRSWMYAGRGDFKGQCRDLEASARVAEQHLNRCDLRAVGRTLHALFRSAMELGDDVAASTGERVFHAIEWTEELREEHFLATRALAWHAFLKGESARAQWLFRDSKEIAPSDAWRVMAHVDRSSVARMAGNDVWATDELYEAHAYARRVMWSATSGEERQALLMLAILFANVDLALAQQYAATYGRIGTRTMDPTLALSHDPRTLAFQNYASGHVHRVLGNSQLAERSFEAAYATFDAINYHFRAALAADALVSMGGGKMWAQRSREHAAHFPNSVLHRRIDAGDEPNDELFDGLTALQQRLATAMGEGVELADLSRRFSRSEFTIRREMDTIMRHFNVRSRSELRERLTRPRFEM